MPLVTCKSFEFIQQCSSVEHKRRISYWIWSMKLVIQRVCCFFVTWNSTMWSANSWDLISLSDIVPTTSVLRSLQLFVRIQHEKLTTHTRLRHSARISLLFKKKTCHSSNCRISAFPFFLCYSTLKYIKIIALAFLPFSRNFCSCTLIVPMGKLKKNMKKKNFFAFSVLRLLSRSHSQNMTSSAPYTCVWKL